MLSNMSYVRIPNEKNNLTTDGRPIPDSAKSNQLLRRYGTPVISFMNI
jgi:hypothetical protein